MPRNLHRLRESAGTHLYTTQRQLRIDEVRFQNEGLLQGSGGAILVGVTDTLGRFLLPIAFGAFMDPSAATAVGSALASMLIYILMAVILVWKPTGLMGAA